MAYGDFTYLNRKTAADKVLCNKAFSNAENLKYDGYKCGFQCFIIILIKSFRWSY